MHLQSARHAQCARASPCTNHAPETGLQPRSNHLLSVSHEIACCVPVDC